MTDDALSLARSLYRQGDNLFHAGVKIRMRRLLIDDPELSSDSVFIKAVADEARGEPLPAWEPAKTE